MSKNNELLGVFFDLMKENNVFDCSLRGFIYNLTDGGNFYRVKDYSFICSEKDPEGISYSVFQIGNIIYRVKLVEASYGDYDVDLTTLKIVTPKTKEITVYE